MTNHPNRSNHQPCLIRVTRHYYAGTFVNHPTTQYLGDHFGEVGFDSSAPLIPFASRADAQAAVDAHNEQVYYLRHGESSRPTITIVKVAAAPLGVRQQVR